MASDQELIEQFAQKMDNEIIGEFYKRYGHLVFGVCMKYLKNVQNAEDLTIELFGELSEKIKQHRIVHFKSWLYISTKNSCLMSLRKKSFHSASFDEHTFSIEEEEANINSKEILEFKLKALENAIDQLNEIQAICIKDFYIKKSCYEEISKSHHLTLNEVKSHIQNGKRKLKIILSKVISEK